MKFSNTKQIVVILLVWAVALVAIDYLKNPRPLSEMFGAKKPGLTTAQNLSKPHITLWMNHLCCTGCLADVRDALKKLSWLEQAQIPDEQGLPQQDKVTGQESNPAANRLEIDVVPDQVKLVDFVAIEKALRDVGLVAERIEFGGVRHFRLEADFNHFCCQLCAKSGTDGLDNARKLRTGSGNFIWLDSFEVIKEKKKIVAHAKYDKVADVSEYLTALAHIGFAPSSVTVQFEPER